MRYSVTLFVRAAGVRHPSPSRSSAGVMAAAPGHAGNGNMAVTCEILVHQSDPPLRGALSDILRLVIRPQSAGSVIMAADLSRTKIFCHATFKVSGNETPSYALHSVCPQLSIFFLSNPQRASIINSGAGLFVAGDDNRILYNRWLSNKMIVICQI